MGDKNPKKQKKKKRVLENPGMEPLHTEQNVDRGQSVDRGQNTRSKKQSRGR